jgi:hypothetical protein
VDAIPFGLRTEPHDPALLAAVTTGDTAKVGLAGLLAGRGRRAWRRQSHAPAAEESWAWGLRDNWSPTWWPQGIDVGEHDGRRLLAVSWFAQPKRGVRMGARLSFVDFRDPRRPRYHHVLLVTPVRQGSDAGSPVTLEPVTVHAGGIVWTGDRILVADTAGGIRVFDLGNLLRTSRAMFGYRYLLPQSATYRSTGAKKAKEAGIPWLRYSFLSLEHGGDQPRLVAGEYRNAGAGDRLVRIAIDAGGGLLVDEGGHAGLVDVHEPGVWRMQGACVVDGRWFITSSNGDREGGDLWSGEPGTLTRHRHVLPAGPEDLAYDPRTRQLWSVCEWPRHRRIFSVDPARWPDEAGGRR